ncbi:hypothetical protein [Microbacterium lacus]|uniref:Uncharacterized protein n=1 Tax=Microbacterium lacus TaxID=415217 RepID=A0ABN2H2B7_9MICO
MSIGKAVIRPLKDALDDMPVHVRQLSEMFRKHAQRQNRNTGEVTDLDATRVQPPDGHVPDASRPGVDRGDGRDARGRYATGQENKPWVDKEQLGLAHYAEDNDVEVITTQVRVDYPGSPQNGRKYDGLVANGDGENTYDGIEIKSGGALAKYLQPGNTQYQFDNAVNAGAPARGTLDGNEILVTRVIIREEP